MSERVFQLIQYEATTEQVLKRPLLIVPPWINKFYILDPTPRSPSSSGRFQGHTVFIISWVNPDERLADKTFEDYMRDGVSKRSRQSARRPARRMSTP